MYKPRNLIMYVRCDSMYALFILCVYFFFPDISLSYYIAYLHNLCIFFMPFTIYICNILYMLHICAYLYYFIFYLKTKRPFKTINKEITLS